jgi:hypothetical protein
MLVIRAQTGEHHGVGFIWTKVHSSPAVARRNEVREICLKHGARLSEDQIFYDGKDDDYAYALIELPDDADQQEALYADLRAHHWTGLIHADDHEGGTKPPRSKSP